MAIREEVFNGDVVQVRVRNRHGQRWVEGKVKEVSGKGAFVHRFDDGNDNFYYWNEIRKSGHEVAPKRLGASLAPLLSKALEKAEKPLSLIPRAQDPVVSLDVTPPKLIQNSPSSVVPISEPFHNKVKKKKKRREHTLTNIGNAFRDARLQKKWNQFDTAQKLGISSSALCRIELGDEDPNDDVLLRFCELFESCDLDKYIKMRDGDTSYEAMAKETATEAPPAAAPESIHKEFEMPPTEQKQGSLSFSDFLKKIEEICPMPPPGETRTEWRTIVFSLYELHEKSSK